MEGKLTGARSKQEQELEALNSRSPDTVSEIFAWFFDLFSADIGRHPNKKIVPLLDFKLTKWNFQKQVSQATKRLDLT